MYALLAAYKVTDRPVVLLVRDDGIVNRVIPGGAPDLDPEVAVLTS